MPVEVANGNPTGAWANQDPVLSDGGPVAPVQVARAHRLALFLTPQAAASGGGHFKAAPVKAGLGRG